MVNRLGETELPIYLFHQGTNYNAYELMGVTWTGGDSATFRVWAPNAQAISVVGDFNEWNGECNPLIRVNDQGLWEGHASHINEFQTYKFKLITQDGQVLYKADPYGVYSQIRPDTASVLYKMGEHKWDDQKWVETRQQTNWQKEPVNIYELSLGSWRINEDESPYTYKKIGDELIPYIVSMGYTHIELLPITEFPFDGSWGYQVTGYFAPTSRFGTPDEFMELIDRLHQNNIGVIMDWVPAHFPKDAHGLYKFDGTFCYEYADPQKGEHLGWGTAVFDYGRCEVESFLISSANFWIEKYHIDGIRVDAVASMLYLDYCREDGMWAKNNIGGRENLEAVALIKRMNSSVLSKNPGVMMIAEESTTWPMVTQPDYVGGLGFTFKWNMGWMNDSLAYVETDPLYRGYNHDKLTFAMMYAFNENFILPISHDEVVHGKLSLLNKMSGEYELKFAGLRSFMGNMMAFPGKKLLFMGCEFGQFIEWNYKRQLDWFLLEYPSHQGVHQFVKDINHIYRKNTPLWQVDNSWDGFTWLNAEDNTRNIISYMRTDEDGKQIAVICNFSPVDWKDYVIGLPENCTSVKIMLHTEWDIYGGNLPQKNTTLRTVKGNCGLWNKIVTLDIPAFSTIYFEVRHKKETKPALSGDTAKEPVKRKARKSKTEN